MSSLSVPLPPAEPLTAPTGSPYRLVTFPGPLGAYPAYLTPDPGDGRRHPAILDLHAGFGIMDGEPWIYYDYGQSFRAAGIVHFFPSRRGEAGLPGAFELFWGELDDAKAALAYLRALPYVDPQRIYVVGHSTGGTLALLLAAESSGIRATLSFEGAPDIAPWMQQFTFGGAPLDLARTSPEVALRSPLTFVGSIRCPTWYLYGADGSFAESAVAFRDAAARAGSPYVHVVPLRGTDHQSVFYYLSDWIVEEVVAGDDPALPFPLVDPLSPQAAFDNYWLRDIPNRDHRTAYDAARFMAPEPMLAAPKAGAPTP